ncbi:hypothetical protein M758_UG095700 [Ceratodon purpureus]|nr:hypothetical protein M758_UG095700 [Ceratodon purpureus]
MLLLWSMFSTLLPFMFPRWLLYKISTYLTLFTLVAELLVMWAWGAVFTFKTGNDLLRMLLLPLFVLSGPPGSASVFLLSQPKILPFLAIFDLVKLSEVWRQICIEQLYFHRRCLQPISCSFGNQEGNCLHD